jgi:hypothetical protein
MACGYFDGIAAITRAPTSGVAVMTLRIGRLIISFSYRTAIRM